MEKLQKIVSRKLGKVEDILQISVENIGELNFGSIK
jgi:hypothetical protein